MKQRLYLIVMRLMKPLSEENKKVVE